MGGFRRVCAAVAAFAMALAASSTAVAWAEEDSAGIRPIDVQVSDDGSVSVTVAVPDLSAAAVDPATAFEVLQDGDRRDVDAVALETGDLEVAVVVDTSAEQSEQPLRELHNFGMELALRLPRDTTMALVSSGHPATVVQPATSGVLERAAGTGRLEPGGEQALYDALVLAVDELSARPDAHRRVLVLGVSEDLASRATPDDVRERLELANAALFVVLPAAEGSGGGVLGDVATSTGGRVVNLEDYADPFEAVAELRADLLHQYRLTFDGHGVTPVTIRVDTETFSAETAVDLPSDATPDEGRAEELPPGDAETAAPRSDDGGDTEVLAAPQPDTAPQASGVEGWLILTATLGALTLIVAGAALWTARRHSWLPAGRANSPANAVMGHPHPRPRQSERAAPPDHVTPAPEVTASSQGRPVAQGQRSRVRSADPRADDAASPPVTAGTGALTTARSGFLRALGGLQTMLVRPAAAVAKRVAALPRMVASLISPLAALVRSIVPLLSGMGQAPRRGAALAAAGAGAVARTATRPLRSLASARSARGGLPARVRTPARPPSSAWHDVAADIHREVGGEEARLHEAAGRIEATRSQTAASVRAAGLDGRLAAITLTPLPAVVGTFGYLVHPAYLERLSAGAMGWLSLAAAAALAVVGAWWLFRVAKPPFAAHPARWRSHEARAHQQGQVADALDRAWLYAVAGLDVESAVRRAVSGDDHPAHVLLDALRSIQAGGQDGADGDGVPERTPDWVGVALQRAEAQPAENVLAAARARLHAGRVREAEAQARWLPAATAVPFLFCILPATLIVGLLVWA